MKQTTFLIFVVPVFVFFACFEVSNAQRPPGFGGSDSDPPNPLGICELVPNPHSDFHSGYFFKTEFNITPASDSLFVNDEPSATTVTSCGVGGGQQDHEIEINLRNWKNSNYFATTNYGVPTDVPPGNQPSLIKPYHAKVTAVNDNAIGFYRKQSTASSVSVIIPVDVNHSIRDNISGATSNSYCLNSCQTEFYFWGEPGTSRGLANGGIYRLDAPGRTPLYFAFPYQQGIWFNFGPDMSINYSLYFSSGNDIWDPNAQPGDTIRTSNYDVEEFCGVGASAMLPNSYQNTGSYLASYDLNDLLSFWGSNSISVGFDPNSAIIISPQNLVRATASNSIDTPPTQLGQQVISLNKVGSGFEVDKPFTATIAAGEMVWVNIFARFADNSIISRWKPYQYVTQGPGNSPKRIVVDVQGKLVDYRVRVFRNNAFSESE